MLATPGCPTPAPVPPCPLHLACCLPPHHTHSVTTRTTSPRQHPSTAQRRHTHTRLPRVARSQQMAAHVLSRSSDVSDTRLPNAGASAAMPSAPSLLSVTTPYTCASRNVTTRSTSRTRLPFAPLMCNTITPSTYPAGPAMSTTPGRPTLAPVPPCPLHQACSLQPQPERERERERRRERDRERQRERESERARQREGERERQTERETERDKQRETKRYNPV